MYVATYILSLFQPFHNAFPNVHRSERISRSEILQQRETSESNVPRGNSINVFQRLPLELHTAMSDSPVFDQTKDSRVINPSHILYGAIFILRARNLSVYEHAVIEKKRLTSQRVSCFFQFLFKIDADAWPLFRVHRLQRMKSLSAN